MPRKSRIDAPGELHHIIVRGIERRKIYLDDADRNNFIDRVGSIVSEANSFELLGKQLYMCGAQNNPH